MYQVFFAKRGGPGTPSRTTITNLDRAFVKKLFFFVVPGPPVCDLLGLYYFLSRRNRYGLGCQTHKWKNISCCERCRNSNGQDNF